MSWLLLALIVVVLLVVAVYLYLRWRYGAAFAIADFFANPLSYLGLGGN